MKIYTKHLVLMANNILLSIRRSKVRDLGLGNMLQKDIQERNKIVGTHRTNVFWLVTSSLLCYISWSSGYRHRNPNIIIREIIWLGNQLVGYLQSGFVLFFVLNLIFFHTILLLEYVRLQNPSREKALKRNFERKSVSQSFCFLCQS